jgi:hypothetical protein
MENDEWAEHFWRLFDEYIRLAQQPRLKAGPIAKLRRLFGRGRN